MKKLYSIGRIATLCCLFTGLVYGQMPEEAVLPERTAIDSSEQAAPMQPASAQAPKATIAAPVFHPESGSTVLRGSYVSITCETAPVTILYSLGEEVTAGRVYNGAIKITQDTTYISAVAVALDGSGTSAATKAVYYAVDDSVIVDPIYAAASVAIDEEHFPDENFRQYIRETFDMDDNDTLTASERTRGMEITINERNITDLKGIEYFQNLKTLYCHNNYQLQKADLSRNVQLQRLEIGTSSLDMLDLRHNGNLENLQIYSSYSLQCILLDGAYALKDVYMGHIPRLKRMDLGSKPYLKSFSCYEMDSLIHLDLGYCTALEDIRCSDNRRLSILNVSGDSNLYSLHCENTSVSTLELSHCAALQQLYADNTNLSSIDVTHCPYLRELYLDGTAIDYLNLENNPILGELKCSATALTSLDLSHNAELYLLECDNSYREVSPDSNLKFDLRTLEGFVIGKASDWHGGTVKGDTLTFSAPVVNYRYATGYKGRSEEIPAGISFTLSQPTEGIAIDEIRFPDKEFRNYVSERMDMNNDTMLSGFERARVVQIDVHERNIGDLTGLAYFSNLKLLNAKYNNIQKLDVSKNPLLQELDLWGAGSFDSLDLRHNPDLVVLSAGSNTSLADIRLEGTKALQSINLDYCNRLKTLDLRHHPVLDNVTVIESDSLVRIDVTDCPALRLLDCHYNNRLESLVLDNHANLNDLFCYHTSLKQLDLMHCPALRNLQCHNTKIKDLDISRNTNLGTLHCWGTPITRLDIGKNRNLSDLKCSGTAITSLDLSQQNNLYELECENTYYEAVLAADGTFPLDSLPGFDIQRASQWKGGTVNANRRLTFSEDIVTYQYTTRYAGYNGSGEIPSALTFRIGKPQDGIAIDSAHFPDDRFRAYVKMRFDLNDDNKLNAGEQHRVVDIDVHNAGISLMNGLEYFPDLLKLTLGYNNITKLDLRQNTQLKELDFWDMQVLDTLDLRPCTELRRLHGGYNHHLKYLHLGSSRSFQSVSLDHVPGIKQIDLSSQKSLKQVHVNDCDSILSLLVNDCPKLTELYCYNDRQLHTLNIDNDAALRYISCYNTSLRTLDVTQSPQLNHIECNSTKISKLEIEKLTQLNYLNCSQTNIEYLDLSTNPYLNHLKCSGTALTSLDLSHNSSLYELVCENSYADVALSPINTFYLRVLPGFDMQRASDWTGGTVDTYLRMLTFTDSVMTYQYETRYNGYNKDIPEKLTFQLGVFKYKTDDFEEEEPIQIPKPVFSPDSGSLLLPGAGVTIRCDAEDAEIYYSIGASIATLHYEDSIRVTQNPTVIRALAFVPGVGTSEPATAIYYVVTDSVSDSTQEPLFIPAPEFSLENETTVKKGTYLKLSCSMPEAAIYYSLDRKGTAFSLYTDSIVLIEDTTFVRAYAVIMGVGNSAQASGVFYSVLEKVPLKAPYIPDSFFCDYLRVRFDWDEDDSLSIEERSMIERIFIDGSVESRKPLKDITGIRYFANLAEIRCNYTDLSFVDLRWNRQLKSLYLNNNALTSLDLSHTPELKNASCLGAICNINVEPGETFDLGTLRGFDTRRAFNWKGGRVNGNRLTFDDPTVTYQYLTRYDGTEPNVPDTLTFTLIAVGEPEERIAIDEQHFPDPIFREYVSMHFDIDEDEFLDMEEREFVQRIAIWGDVYERSSLKSLQGIRYFQNMFELWCSHTMLQSLDLRQNGRLTTLLCNNTFLTSLDLSRNPMLTSVSCEGSVYEVNVPYGGTFNLRRLPDFDPDRAFDWQGATVQNGILTFVDTVVTYQYNTGYVGEDEEVPSSIAFTLVCTGKDLALEGCPTVSRLFSAYTFRNTLYVRDAQGPVEVFNLKGQLVDRGYKNEFSLPAKGIYLVRNQGYTLKVANF